MRAELLVAAWALSTLAGCGSRGSAAVVVEQAPAHGKNSGIDHPYFPLHPGTVWYYEGEEDGEPLREEVAVLEPETWIDAQECVPLQQRRYVADTLVEITTEWFAQDREGNIWQWGEESFFAENGQFVPSRDSWRAGQAGAFAVLLMRGQPKVGDVIVLDLPHGTETQVVVSASAALTTPAGVFTDCLEVHENPDDPDQDILLYAPGTGLAALRAANGYKMLVSVQAPR